MSNFHLQSCFSNWCFQHRAIVHPPALMMMLNDALLQLHSDFTRAYSEYLIGNSTVKCPFRVSTWVHIHLSLEKFAFLPITRDRELFSFLSKIRQQHSSSSKPICTLYANPIQRKTICIRHVRVAVIPLRSTDRFNQHECAHDGFNHLEISTLLGKVISFKWRFILEKTRLLWTFHFLWSILW